MSSKKQIKKDWDKLDLLTEELKKEKNGYQQTVIPNEAFQKKWEALENHVAYLIKRYEACNVPKKYKSKLTNLKQAFKLHDQNVKDLMKKTSNLTSKSKEVLESVALGNFSQLPKDTQEFIEKIAKHDLTNPVGRFEATKEIKNRRAGSDVEFLISVLFNAVSLFLCGRSATGKNILEQTIIPNLDGLIARQTKKLSNKGIAVQTQTSDEILIDMRDRLPIFILDLVEKGQYKDAEEILSSMSLFVDSLEKAKTFFEKIMEASLPYPNGREEFLKLLKEKLFSDGIAHISDGMSISHHPIHDDSRHETHEEEQKRPDIGVYLTLLSEAEKVAPHMQDHILKTEYEETILQSIRELKRNFMPSSPGATFPIKDR